MATASSAGPGNGRSASRPNAYAADRQREHAEHRDELERRAVGQLDAEHDDEHRAPRRAIQRRHPSTRVLPVHEPAGRPRAGTTMSQPPKSPTSRATISSDGTTM